MYSLVKLCFYFDDVALSPLDDVKDEREMWNKAERCKFCELKIESSLFSDQTGCVNTNA